MTMYYWFFDSTGGPKMGYDDRTSFIGTDVTPEYQDIHVEAPTQVDGEERCPLRGDTYQAKETIKSTDFSRVGYGWFDDFWAAYPEGLDDLIPALLNEGYDVSAEPEAVHACEGLQDFHSVIPLENRENEYMVFDRPPEGEDRRASESYVEKAMEMGNFDDKEEFCGRFDLEPVPDEELMEELGVSEDDDRVSFATSGNAR